MRVPLPGSLKLEAEALLRDVRDRLSERLPAYAEADDPTDPGWVLLEQSAWMVEALSEQLDQYPYAVIQYFVRMMGGHLRPAQPAVGVVVADPLSDGRLTTPTDTPSPFRFYTSQTETSDAVEFVPIEPSVSLRKATIASVSELVDGELFRAGKPETTEGFESAIVWSAPAVRSELFDGERIRFSLVGANPEELHASLESAVNQVKGRKIGWLSFEVEPATANGASLVVKIDPSQAFVETAPGGLAPGGDLEGDWGVLQDTSWTPPVRIADQPLLPPRLRGSRPLPASVENRFLLPDIPIHFPLERLLVKRASPVPRNVVDAIWSTIAGADTRLQVYRPVVRRVLAPPEEAEGEPQWVAGALDGGVWEQFGTGPTSLIHVRVEKRSNASLRVGLVLASEDSESLPPLQVFGELEEGLLMVSPLTHKIAWRLPCPPPEAGRTMVTLVALDVQLHHELSGVVIAVQGRPLATTLNPLLVANLPAVRDGRQIVVNRNVPEGVSLLFPDVVGPTVIQQLLEDPIPADAAALLKQVRLAHFPILGQAPLNDFEGVGLDPTEGEMTMNGLDDAGNQRTLRPGALLELSWYRRTDGARGNVAKGSIQSVEQESGSEPTLLRVYNPLGTFYGAAREGEQAALDRMFGPMFRMPVLPTDFERMVRQSLGSRGAGWMVRCWSYAERALITTSVWPVLSLGAPPEAETAALEQALSDAGPDKLLVVVGPPHGRLSTEDLDWARRTIRRMCQRLAERLPTVRDAVVTRFWPLTLTIEESPKDLQLPCFHTEGLPGVLRDEQGREAPPPPGLLLNAAITRVESQDEGFEV